MKYIVLYLGTVILSKVMDVISELRYYRDAADYGYKINKERLNRIKKEELIVINNNIFEYFIPFYNIVSVVNNSLKYKEFKNMIFAILNTYGVFVKMSDKEIKDYEEKPTPFNAYKISLMSEFRLRNTNIIVAEDKNEIKNIIYYKSQMGNYKIVEINGPLANKSEEEQDEVFFEALEKSLNDDVKNLENELKVHTEEARIGIVKKIDEIDKLKLLKKELLKQKKKQQEEKDKTLTKKR